MLRRVRLARQLLAADHLPQDFMKLSAWLEQFKPPGTPALTAPEVLQAIKAYLPADPTGREYKYTPWLIREVSSKRLKLTETTVPYLHAVLDWFVWLRSQDPVQVEEAVGFPADDRSWTNIMAFRYSDRGGGGLASLYRDFKQSNTALARQYQNYLRH